MVIRRLCKNAGKVIFVFTFISVSLLCSPAHADEVQDSNSDRIDTIVNSGTADAGDASSSSNLTSSTNESDNSPSSVSNVPNKRSARSIEDINNGSSTAVETADEPNSDDQESNVVFKDPVFRQKMASLLGVDESSLTPEYLSNIKYAKENSEGYFNRNLEIMDASGVTSLEGIEYLGNMVTRITLKNASLTSLSPLNKLNNLYTVDISNNKTTILDPSALYTLNTKKTDNQNKLYSIILSGNKIKLSDLPDNLETKLSQDPTRSTTANFTGTKFVNDDGENANSDEINKFLSMWSNANKILLDRTNIKNLDFMNNAPKDRVKVINVSNNLRLNNIDGLKGANNLIEYTGDSTSNSSSLDVFNGMNNLEVLRVSNGQIRTAGELDENNFSKLKKVFLGSNYMNEKDLDKILAAMKTSEGLKEFHMDKNMLADISALDKYDEFKHMNFKTISFQMNNITDFSALEDINAEEKWIGGQFLIIGDDKYYTESDASPFDYVYTGRTMIKHIANPGNVLPGGRADKFPFFYPAGSFARRDVRGIVKSPNLISDLLANEYVSSEIKELIKNRHDYTNFFRILRGMEGYENIRYSDEKPFLQVFYRDMDPEYYYNGEFKKASGYILIQMPAPGPYVPTTSTPGTEVPEIEKPNVAIPNQEKPNHEEPVVPGDNNPIKPEGNKPVDKIPVKPEVSVVSEKTPRGDVVVNNKKDSILPKTGDSQPEIYIAIIAFFVAVFNIFRNIVDNKRIDEE